MRLRLLKYSAFVFLILIFSLTTTAQLNYVDSKLTNYPIDTVIVHDRNPDGIDTSRVSIIEYEKTILPKSVTELKLDQSNSQGKCVLILFENHYGRKDETEFFKTLLQSISSDIVGADDEYLFTSFDWAREENDNKVLFLDSKETTNSSGKLNDWAGSVNPKSNLGKTADHGKSSQIFRAIMEGLEILEGIVTDKPKMLIVLSGEFSYTFDPDYDDSESVIKSSLKQNVSIYSVGYDIGMGDTYRLHELAKETFGLYGTFDKNQTDEAADALVKFMSEAEQRAKGKTYQIVFETTHPKDGKAYISQLQIGEEGTPIPVQTPNPSLLDWIKSNVILSIILGIVFITLIVLVVLLIKKNKRQKELEAAQSNQRFSEVEEKNQQAQEQIRTQEEILKHKDERERIQQEKALEEQREIARAKKEAEQIVLMKQGGLPRLSGTFQGQHGELFIDKPIVSIGRKDNNYYTLNHVTVSGNHAEIRFQDGKYFVRDLDSKNGTMVNGRKITEQELKHGDVVEFGEIALTYLK